MGLSISCKASFHLRLSRSRRLEQSDTICWKLSESEEKYRYCLQLRRLRCNENWIVWNWLVPLLLLAIPPIEISLDLKHRSRNGIVKNETIVILSTQIPSSLWLHLRLRFWFLLGMVRKHSHDSDYDAIASGNQPFCSNPLAARVISRCTWLELARTGWWMLIECKQQRLRNPRALISFSEIFRTFLVESL